MQINQIPSSNFLHNFPLVAGANEVKPLRRSAHTISEHAPWDASSGSKLEVVLRCCTVEEGIRQRIIKYYRIRNFKCKHVEPHSSNKCHLPWPTSL